MSESAAGWDDLALFLAVAREAGLSPAAKVTSRSPATLGRRMLALERALGRELFIRHDRGYTLTPEGETLLAELSEVEARIERATLPPAGEQLPLVKISAGTWTTLALVQRLGEIAGEPLDTRLRFVSAEDILDIGRREVVIGIRNRRPTEPALAGRKLTELTFAPYRRADAPDRWIKVMSDTPSARWLDHKIGDTAACEVTSPRNALDLVLAGMGKAVLPGFIGNPHPDLEQVGPVIPELTHDRWLVTHQDDRHLPEVRRVIDRLVRVCARIG